MPSQDSLLDQLTEVISLANQHGYYDAADWIGERLRERQFGLGRISPREPNPPRSESKDEPGVM